MLVNEKVWRNKSPEAVALAVTQSFYSLYSRGPGLASSIEAAMKEFAQTEIDTELAKVAKVLQESESREGAMKGYVV